MEIVPGVLAWLFLFRIVYLFFKKKEIFFYEFARNVNTSAGTEGQFGIHLWVPDSVSAHVLGRLLLSPLRDTSSPQWKRVARREAGIHCRLFALLMAKKNSIQL